MVLEYAISYKIPSIEQYLKYLYGSLKYGYIIIKLITVSNGKKIVLVDIYLVIIPVSK